MRGTGLLLLVALAALFQVNQATHWALLVAGSNGYYNYRHQADICHAYQLLHKNGIPDENIVVMMYDDIAYNRENPTPGKIINRPGGPDVYTGVPIDYKHKDVTPENFLKILQGYDMTGVGSEKTIKSGADDRVFVYFADHGAPGLIAFPAGELHAQDLNNAILSMHAQKKYKEMVMYIEACESGSMFNRHKLPSNINVYATTAANGAESSYACYWDKERDTYLGDVYSVKWMENSDQANLKTETLHQQYLIVKKEVNTSHVQEFGDLTMGPEVLGIYQGEVKSNETKVYPEASIADAVPSPEVPMMILYHKLQKAKTAEEHRSIMYMMEMEQKKRVDVKKTITAIVSSLYAEEEKQSLLMSRPATPNRDECYKQAVTTFREKCFNFSEYEYALRHVFVLANLCDEGLHSNLIVKSIESACAK